MFNHFLLNGEKMDKIKTRICIKNKQISNYYYKFFSEFHSGTNQSSNYIIIFTFKLDFKNLFNHSFWTFLLSQLIQ